MAELLQARAHSVCGRAATDANAKDEARGMATKRSQVRLVSPRRSARHRRVPDLLAQRIGSRIHDLRADVGLGFNAFVTRTGLGRGYVSELERGLVVPTVASLARVAEALGVTVADLVVGTSERERLFDELRGEPMAVVRELRERIRSTTREETPGPRK